MGQFQLSGVTTVLWPGGLNGNYGKAAAAAGYQPEWILVGDGLLDGNYPVILSQNSASFDGHAIILSPEVLKPGLEQQICYQAYREVDKTTPRSDVGYTCDWYVNLFQFMVGVQVAGPRLGPTSLDKGFHSIPQFQSGSPTVPACFYLPGDYTCVKDAQAEIWNASERPPGAREPGCWKAIEAGKRYLAGRWPPGNTDAQIDGSEPCNGYSTSVRFNPT
jgi:hypothetical protein